MKPATLEMRCLQRARDRKQEKGGGWRERKRQHMLMKACAGSGESRGSATPRAHSGSVERSLERIGCEGGLPGWIDFLSLSVSRSLSSSLCLSSTWAVSVRRWW